MSGHHHTPELHEHADVWHSHGRAEGLPQTEHLSTLNTTLLAKWFVLIVISLAVLMIAVAMYFSREITALRLENQERTAWQRLSSEARETRASAERVLSAGGQNESFDWVSGAEGRVQIPISHAMDKIEARYRNRGN